MKDKHFTSRMLTSAGALMSISGFLMAVCAKIAYGNILFAAAVSKIRTPICWTLRR